MSQTESRKRKTESERKKLVLSKFVTNKNVVAEKSRANDSYGTGTDSTVEGVYSREACIFSSDIDYDCQYNVLSSKKGFIFGRFFKLYFPAKTASLSEYTDFVAKAMSGKAESVMSCLYII